jgi:hypothetical protein
MGRYYGEWEKDKNEPWTPNQKAEVVRETGMQRKWLHMFEWTHGEAYDNISGFRRAEVPHFDEMFDPVISTWDESLENVIFRTTCCIAKGVIKFDVKDVRRLTPRARERLYEIIDGEIRDQHNQTQLTKCQIMIMTEEGVNCDDWRQVEDYWEDVGGGILDDGGENLKDFFEYFSEMLIADLRSGMKLLENNPKLQKQVAKVLDVANPLYNKIEERDGGWYFLEEEGQNREYKQTAFVFSEDNFNNKNKTLFAGKKKQPKPYNDKLEDEKNKFELLNITKTVCSFLNTEGGEMYVGVNNDTGRIVGLDEDKKSRFPNDTDFNFADHYKRHLEMKFRQIENYLPHNIKMKMERGKFPTLLQISVTPIESSGTPAEVKGRKKDRLDKTIKFVRVNDEDIQYTDGKWSRYCRKRFPQHHEANY